MGEKERARSGGAETGVVPQLIDAVRNTDTGKLPMLKFAWQAPASDPKIHNYGGQLHRVSDGSMEQWSGGGTPDAPALETSVTFSGSAYGLQSLQQYKFRVRAVNTVGAGHWSEWTSLIDPPRGFCLDAPALP